MLYYTQAQRFLSIPITATIYTVLVITNRNNIPMQYKKQRQWDFMNGDYNIEYQLRIIEVNL